MKMCCVWMFAYISNFELTILWLLLAVPTGIAFVRHRFRRRKSNANAAMGGCLTLALGASVFGALLIGSSLVQSRQWTQPDKMLSRFLKVEDVSEFSDLRSKYVGGLDYTAWVYFRTSKQRFDKLVADLEFERLPDSLPNQGLESAGFSGAPPLPTAEQAVIYYRKSPEIHDIQYIVTNSEHNQGWFVSLDY